MNKSMERYARRAELMAQKRKLQEELSAQRAQLLETQDALGTIDRQIAALDHPPGWAPASATLTSPR
jgi:Tfp pilus assembly protein FimV